jgi:hypothetical protein
MRCNARVASVMFVDAEFSNDERQLTFPTAGMPLRARWEQSTVSRALGIWNDSFPPCRFQLSRDLIEQFPSLSRLIWTEVDRWTPMKMIPES